jgi:malic enzyme
VLGFPFIFRGALDVRATGINDAMKIAAATPSPNWRANACPRKWRAAYGVAHSFGPEYIIPAPFDPRLMEVVPPRSRRRRWIRASRQADPRHCEAIARLKRAAQPDHIGADARL